MSNLLQVSRAKSAAVTKGAMPLLLDVHVAPETAPYLVSSSSSFLWVEEPFEGKFVRAAVRTATPAEMFQQVLQAILARGREACWGNVHPFTLKGVQEALAHVESFELGDLEVLMPPESISPRPEWAEPATLQYPIRFTSWLSAPCAVVVPADREYVGVLFHLDARHTAAVVHNAARGVAVAIGA